MFKSYADLSGYNEAALLSEYKRGLNIALKGKVTNTWPAPKTLDDWQKRSCELDRAWRSERRDTLRKTPSNNDRNPRGQPRAFNDRQTTASAPAKDPMAMDIDNYNDDTGCARRTSLVKECTW